MTSSAARQLEPQQESLFIQDVGNFTELLSTAVASIAKDSPMPILTSVLVEANGNELVLTGSDSVATVRVKGEGVTNIMGEIRFAIPGKFFYEAMKKLPEGTVEIVILPDVSATIKVMVGKKQAMTMQLNLLEVEQYPAYVRKPLPSRFSIKPKVLALALKSTVYAALKRDDHIMSGIHLEGREGNIYLSATDRHRLAHVVIPNDELPEAFSSLVVASSAAKEMVKLIENLEDEISVEFSQSEIQIVTEKLVYQTRFIDGTYPDVHKILNPNYTSDCKVKRTDLLSALERARICVSDYKTISFSLGTDGIMLKARSDGPSYEEEVPVVSSNGQVTLGVDVFYMLEAIKNIVCDVIHFKFSGPLSPIRLEPELDGEEMKLLGLVIPVRMNKE